MSICHAKITLYRHICILNTTVCKTLSCDIGLSAFAVWKYSSCLTQNILFNKYVVCFGGSFFNLCVRPHFVDCLWYVHKWCRADCFSSNDFSTIFLNLHACLMLEWFYPIHIGCLVSVVVIRLLVLISSLGVSQIVCISSITRKY